jgi:hypothetical protein
MIQANSDGGGAVLESAKDMLKSSIYVTTQAAAPSFTPSARTCSLANISAQLEERSFEYDGNNVF